MNRTGWAALVAAGAMLAFVGPAAALPGCETFLQKMRTDGADIGLDYSRALVISRVHTNTLNYDISTRADADGTLVCQGDQFVRFEAHVLEPLRGRAAEGFVRLQEVAIRAAFGWDAGKAKGVSKSLAVEAREYLAASKERGDSYIAGKTERHEPGGVGLGMIYTEVDRAFVIVVEN
jgi:hypothetical protein